MKPSRSPPSFDSDEQSASKPAQRVGRFHQLRRRLSQKVRPCLWNEIQLAILTVCTGIQDATSFPVYRCFASNQTGNTVFLILSVILTDTPGVLFITTNVGISLVFFLAGSFVTGHLGHFIGPRLRLWLIVSNLIQTCLVFTAAAVDGFMQASTANHQLEASSQPARIGAQARGNKAVVVIALLAFAAGSQVVQSRSLGITEISTAMATAAWVDFMMDPNLFKFNNRARNRRAAFLTALIAGSAIGAAFLRIDRTSIAILVSGVGKLVVTISYLAAPAEVVREEIPFEVGKSETMGKSVSTWQSESSWLEL